MKELTLKEAAQQMAELTQDYLDKLTPQERAEKVKAFRETFKKIKSRKGITSPTLSSSYKSSKEDGRRGIPVTPVLSRSSKAVR